MPAWLMETLVSAINLNTAATQMNNFYAILFPLFLPFLGGAILGVMFFGGRWWTVNNAVESLPLRERFFSGFIPRFILVILGFYLITYGHWLRLLACISGFIFAYYFLIWLNAVRVLDIESDMGER